VLDFSDIKLIQSNKEYAKNVPKLQAKSENPKKTSYISNTSTNAPNSVQNSSPALNAISNLGPKAKVIVPVNAVSGLKQKILEHMAQNPEDNPGGIDITAQIKQQAKNPKKVVPKVERQKNPMLLALLELRKDDEKLKRIQDEADEIGRIEEEKAKEKAKKKKLEEEKKKLEQEKKKLEEEKNKNNKNTK